MVQMCSFLKITYNHTQYLKFADQFTVEYIVNIFGDVKPVTKKDIHASVTDRVSNLQ